ncbi:MAG: hypothetical protein HY749_04165 [Gammaproteobacteria bacterium]|nr:hypothetical protein [Gammaproteobacteria bacterium]
MMLEQHLALHGLAIKKHADAAAVASAVGLEPARVECLLKAAVETGRAVEAQGAFVLSPAGRMILDGHYSRVYGELRENHAFVTAYDRFERVNGELKQVITDWQTMDVGGQKVRNDHSNEDYDAHVLDRLGEVHDRFMPILAQLARHLPRLQRYAQKLEAALDRAEDGAKEWVSDAKLESYHTVWFEMHEDLLRILGRQRDE